MEACCILSGSIGCNFESVGSSFGGVALIGVDVEWIRDGMKSCCDKIKSV